MIIIDRNYRQIYLIGYRQYIIKDLSQKAILKKKQKQMNAEYKCDTCQMFFDMYEPFCPFCEGIPMETAKITSKLVCESCGSENQLSSDVCVVCHSDLFEQSKKQCELCGFRVKESLYEEHKTNCFLSLEMVEMEKEILEEEKRVKLTEQPCKYCGIKFSAEFMEDHYQVCEKAFKQMAKKKPPVFNGKKGAPRNPFSKVQEDPVAPFSNEIEIDPAPYDPDNILELSEMKRMSKLQNDAILHMHQRSRDLHNKAIRVVQDKVAKLGYKKADLENLHFYIQNYAPIIIHIHITRHMQFFIKDTHYRNQFETNKSSGSLSRASRTNWQDRMFDKKYSKASDFERVKYGVINFTNDPKGVKCALSYGQSYLLLKEHVRPRCTFTNKDSSSSDAQIGTFKYPFHVIEKMNDNELKSAFSAAKAIEQSSSVTSTYKEIQIHGPIEFGKDIERMYVNKKEVKDKKFLDMVYKFAELFKVDYEFI